MQGSHQCDGKTSCHRHQAELPNGFISAVIKNEPGTKLCFSNKTQKPACKESKLENTTNNGEKKQSIVTALQSDPDGRNYTKTLKVTRTTDSMFRKK